MNPRIIGIELRRSGALWAGAAVLALSLVACGTILVLSRDHPDGWGREWIGLSLAIRYLTTYLWPMALGAGAIQGLRVRRSGATGLLDTTARPVWQREAATAGALTAALVGAALIPVAADAALLAGKGAFFHLAVVPMALVGLLAVASGAWLGMGVGRLLPSPLTPPILAVGTFLLQLPLWRSQIDAQQGGAPRVPARVFLLVPGLTGVPDAWTVLAGRVDLGQAAWFLGLAGTGLVLLAAGRRGRLLAAVPVTAGLLVAQVLFPAQAPGMYTTDSAAARLVCSGSVCVTRLHQPRLAAITAPAESALRRLRILPDAPTRVEETTVVLTYRNTRPRTAAVVPIWFDGNPFYHLSAEDIERGLLMGAGVLSCLDASTVEDPPGLRETAARNVAAAWFLGDLKPLHYDKVDRLAQSGWDTLRRLPQTTQRARIIALRAAALSCNGDLLDILTTGNGTDR